MVIEPLDGLPCFHGGYAVPNSHRKKGIATATFGEALKELSFGFNRAGIGSFYVETIIGLDNIASQKISERVLGVTPVRITDEVSRRDALRYLRRFDQGK